MAVDEVGTMPTVWLWGKALGGATAFETEVVEVDAETASGGVAAVGVESLTPCANAQSGASNKERIEIVGFMGLSLILSNQGLNNKLKNYDKRAN